MFIDQELAYLLVGRQIVGAVVDHENYCLTLQFEDGPQLDVWPTSMKESLKIELTFAP